jgi:hypothetical protein
MESNELKEGVPAEEQSPATEVPQEAMTELMLRTRAKIFSKHPKGAVLADVYNRVTTGQEVSPTELEEARQLICELGKKDIQRIGVSHHWLDDMDLTTFGLVAKSFSELGIVREDMRTLTWSTEEQAIRNIRNRFFRHNPDMKAEIESAEKLLASDQVSPDDTARISALKLRLTGMITYVNLITWGLSGYNRTPGMKSVKDVLEKSFLNPSKLASAAESPAVHAIQAKPAEDDQAAQEKTPEDFEAALRATNPACLQTHRIVRYLRMRGTKLTRKDVNEFLVGIEKTREAVRSEMFSIWNHHRQVITDDIIKINSSWVIKYSIHILEFLFGKAGADYFQSKDFCDYADSHKTPVKDKKK